jgi:predicted lipid-binding transport protein (Tim44 family)
MGQQAVPQQAPRPSYTPPPYQAPQPAGGGFFRSMAGGLLGGMLGGMLFRGMGFGATGGWGGSGIGLFEIILIGGIIYLIYRMVKRNREAPAPHEANVYRMEEFRTPEPPAPSPLQEDRAIGLSHIRQMDPGFDEQRFTDLVMDIFFRIQGAWMNRDLTPVDNLLTREMRGLLQQDIDRMRQEHRINRLENIAVRTVEITEAWQEAGQDFITTRIYANLLDYTTDDTTGQVVAGSTTEPVKFEEFWTFTRSVGNNQWQLSAIDQK